jgi:hypothetical protein
MFKGSIIDELVRSVEMVEQNVYRAPVSVARSEGPGLQLRNPYNYEVTYSERAVEVA